MKTIVKLLIMLFLALTLCVIKAFPQALSISTGYSSEGLTSAMFTAEYSNHVFYYKAIQDEVIASNEEVGYIEKHESVFGYGYRVHENVTLLSGVGMCHNRIVYEYNFGNGFKRGLNNNSFEYGFRWDFISMNKKKFEHINMTLTALMSTYTGLSTMV